MIETRETHACHGGTLGLYRHEAKTLGLPANVTVFMPPGARADAPVAAVVMLAGLTCNDETFLTKSGAIRFAAEHGLALVAPDTSPRGANVPGEDDAYDLGTGAGFYLDATEAPWAAHYRMGSYLAEELPALIAAHFPIDAQRLGLMGHSMGGHGALVHGLKAPGQWKSVSAFAPIVHPAAVPWGEKAFTAYLGPDRAAWNAWDATALLTAGHTHPYPILVDQGEADQFLRDQLQPEHLEAAAGKAHQALMLRRHAGYDHSYWFIQSFVADHIAHHAKALAT